MQGEGFQTGKNAIFCRFSGCNLWSGHEKDREKAICNWCDTDFVGNNGINGGNYSNNEIINIIKKLWPAGESSIPFIVFTGGEPLLQLKKELIELIHSIGFEIGIETNGTILAPSGINWVCVSPKAYSNFILKKGNELKVVFPQEGIDPLDFKDLEFEHFYIQPMDGKDQKNNIKESKKFIKRNPLWKLSLQTHKTLGIP